MNADVNGSRGVSAKFHALCHLNDELSCEFRPADFLTWDFERNAS